MSEQQTLTDSIFKKSIAAYNRRYDTLICDVNINEVKVDDNS